MGKLQNYLEKNMSGFIMPIRKYILIWISTLRIVSDNIESSFQLTIIHSLIKIFSGRHTDNNFKNANNKRNEYCEINVKIRNFF